MKKISRLFLMVCMMMSVCYLGINTVSGASAPSVSYRTHVQTYGWQSYVSNGVTAGTTGQSKRLEGINIKLSDTSSGGIQYRTHVQTYGWQNWVSNNTMSGTSGQSKRLEAIQIKLTGSLANQYDVIYRVHAQNIGWMDWAMNGQSAGSATYAYRLEGIQVKLVAKGSIKPTGEHYRTRNVQYRTHVQTFGWQSWKYSGETSGTTGQSKRLEGINISLNDLENVNDVNFSGSGIQYRTHVQDIGWQNYVSNGVMSGTSGQSKRLEAIQINLTGSIANKYDVVYRVHAQHFGWLGWAKNGEKSGTAGYGYRLEGIQIKLVAKESLATNEGNSFHEKVHQHNYDKIVWSKIRQGYACNGCYRDVTGWNDMYACHGGWHTHQWCEYPEYKVCSCGQKIHYHNWTWIKPDYYQNGTLHRRGYYFCYQCFCFSSDGKTIDNSIQPSCDTWVTYFDLSKTPDIIQAVNYTDPMTDVTEPDRIDISGDKRVLQVGDQTTLKALITPNFTFDTYTWSSSHPSVASVDANGKVTAKALGETVITVKTSKGKSDTYTIRVMKENIATVTSARIMINGQDATNNTVTLKPNQSYNATIETNPKQALYYYKYSHNTSDIIGLGGRFIGGEFSTDSWDKGTYTFTDTNSDPAIIYTNRPGKDVFYVDITDVNGHKFTIQGNIIVE